MLLSSKEIRRYSVESDVKMIQPFSEDQLQSASYDVSLSGSIVQLVNMGKPIDPTSDVDLAEMYTKIEIEGDGYVLSPGEFVLVKLTEKICLPDNVSAHIRPRTRFTRSGILIADQHCNPAYEGVLQLGVYNSGSTPFILKKNVRIAQLVFEELKSVPDEVKLYKNKPNAAYNQENEFRGSKFAEASWSQNGQQLYRDVLSSLKGDSGT